MEEIGGDRGRAGQGESGCSLGGLFAPYHSIRSSHVGRSGTLAQNQAISSDVCVGV